MKILIFNSLYFPNIIGGAERSVQILAEGLKKEGITPIVVTTSNKQYVDYINGVKVYYIKTQNIYDVPVAKEQKPYKKPFWHLVDTYNFLYKRVLENIYHHENPDIVHTNNLAGFSVYIWAFFKKQKLPVVHTIRDYYLMCIKSTMFRNNKTCTKRCIECEIFSYLRKNYSKNIDAVVGVSKYILNKHLKYGYFENSKIRKTIYNSVETYNKLKKQNIFSQRKETIKLGFVGTLTKDKGIQFLLENFSKISINGLELHIYGKSPHPEYDKFLKARYYARNIIFHGRKKDMEEIYRNIDILIIPSLWEEPFPRVLIEAYSFGIPVLASNRGGIPEQVIEGKTGFLFDPNKEDSFTNKLKQIVNFYKENKFSISDIITISKKFSTRKLLKEYISVYERLL